MIAPLPLWVGRLSQSLVALALVAACFPSTWSTKGLERDSATNCILHPFRCRCGDSMPHGGVRNITGAWVVDPTVSGASFESMRR